jgi:hypothetical protein
MQHGIYMTFNTSRVILLKRHASPVERKLIRALRALELDGEWALEGAFILKEIGVKEEHLYNFNRLLKFLLVETPSFALLGPQSPFITRDELALLGALGDTANRKASVESLYNGMASASLKKLLEACGLALRIGNVQLKARFPMAWGNQIQRRSPAHTLANPALPFVL